MLFANERQTIAFHWSLNVSFKTIAYQQNTFEWIQYYLHVQSKANVFELVMQRIIGQTCTTVLSYCKTYLNSANDFDHISKWISSTILYAFTDDTFVFKIEGGLSVHQHNFRIDIVMLQWMWNVDDTHFYKWVNVCPVISSTSIGFGGFSSTTCGVWWKWKYSMRNANYFMVNATINHVKQMQTECK